jgi:enediyne biosynthesis protein E5
LTAPRLRIDDRYLAPILVTIVLLVGQVAFGFLESWSRTALAISTAILVEILLARLFFGKWPHLASSYISGISVGMLVRSPEVWPYALCSAISITSKYVLRVEGRHIWNPSNFGIVAMLLLAADTVAGLSVQWGNNLLPMVVVWCFGSVIIHRLGRFHITLTYVASFLAFSVLRAAVTGHPWPSEVAPLTGPMYQLFIFFMITDPKTTVHTRWGQCLVAFLVAAVEAALRLLELVHAPYYALFIVGPAANLVEIALARRSGRAAGMSRA